MKRFLALLASLLIAAPAVAGPPAIPPSAPVNQTNLAAASIPDTTGVTSANMRAWFLARARVLGGTGRAKIGIVGSSTTLGYGAGSGGSSDSNGARPYSMGVKLASLLTTAGLPAEANGFMGSGFTPTYSTYDPRVSFTGGCAYSAFSTVSGTGFNCGSAGTMVFTPTVNADTCDLYYPINGFGTFSWAVDGGSATNISEGGASALGKTTISLGSSGAHTLTISWVSGQVYYIGADCYDSTTPRVDIIPMGWSGGLASNWTTTGNPWSPLTMLGSMGLDTVIIDLGDNDWWETGKGGTQVPPATFVGYLTTIANQAVSAGASVIILIPPPSSSGRSSPATMQTYVSAVHAAFDNVYPIMDFYSRFGSNTASAALYNDSVHLKKSGYATEALALVPVLTTR